MAFRLRLFSKNTYASSLGVFLLVFVIFMNLSLLFLGDFFTSGSGSSAYNVYGVEVLPSDYSSMSLKEREQYLLSLHGATSFFDLEVIWKWGDPWFGVGYRFPDGYEMSAKDYTKFIEGNADSIDLGSVLFNFLVFNPPVLSLFGVVGLILRVFMIACLIIGIVDIVWIG